MFFSSLGIVLGVLLNESQKGPTFFGDALLSDILTYFSPDHLSICLLSTLNPVDNLRNEVFDVLFLPWHQCQPGLSLDPGPL